MHTRSLSLVLALSLAAPAHGADRSSNSDRDGSSSRSRTSETRNDLNDRRDVLRRLPLIAVTQASDIALKRVPGIVTHAEIETNDGIRTWQLDIQPGIGRPVRMWLNANTGAFLRMVER